jgi:hypothetical protein
MDFNDAFIIVGCPLTASFRADARVVGMLEAWRQRNVVTYYPSSGSAEVGYDRIVKFAKAADPKPTHILFVDYDVLPQPNTLRDLVAHDKDIVCGTYPAVQKGIMKWCVSNNRHAKSFGLMDIADLPDELFKAEIGSNGMMLVKMEVFDKIEWPYWRTQYEKDGSKLGADVYFFDKVRDAGFDVWVDPKLLCSHFKMIDLLGMVKRYAE